MKLYKTKEKEIYYYFLKGGQKRFMYRHLYYDMLGKRRERSRSGFITLKDAMRSLLEIKAELLDSDIKPINNNDITVNQLMDLWFDTQKRNWKDSTRGNYSVCVTAIKKLIGHYRLVKLTRTMYERDFINKMFEMGLKSHTVNNRHEVFKIAVNFAVADEILDKNRYSTVRVKVDKDTNNFLTPTKLNTLLSYAKKHCAIYEYTPLLLLAYTGARKGEALALKWNDIDYKKGEISIRGTRDGWGSRSPKTENSYRTIEVDELVFKQLKKYENWCRELKLNLGIQHKKSDLVFITKFNYPLPTDYPNDYLNFVYKKMKEDKVDIRRITVHGLRHTHATILINMNIPPTDIASRLGNTLEMIYRVYAHSFSKVNDKSVSAFSDSLKSNVDSV